MKLCKNEYTIWASLKKLKSSGGNGQTGRYQNDQRWEMGDFCVRGSDLALSPQRPRFHPRSGTKILQAKQHIKNFFFFWKWKVTERGDLRDLLCLQKYSAPFFFWPVLRVLEAFQFGYNTCQCASYSLRACCVPIRDMYLEMENDCSIDSTVSKMILNSDTWRK